MNIGPAISNRMPFAKPACGFSPLRASVQAVLVVVFFLCTLWPPESSAAEDLRTTDLDVKAALLMKFLNDGLVKWPKRSSNTKDGSLTITVLGKNDKLVGALRKNVEIVKTAKVIIRKVEDLSQLTNTEVVFVSEADSSILQELSRLGKEGGVLTVSDATQSRGSMIWFFVNTDDRVRFKVDGELARSSGIEISPQLLRLSESPR